MSEEGRDPASQRKLKRWHCIYNLSVTNASTGSILGYVVDISTAGIMLVSDNPIPPNQDFNLKVVATENAAGSLNISIKAHSLWSKKDASKDCYSTGMNLISPSQGDLDNILNCIQKLTF